ncbi:VOC family protein [soil metagenome]
MGYAKECRSTVIPAMRYQNALVAIEWLCRAFGFEKQAVFMGEGEVVMHAQLTFGNGMVMLGSVQNGTAYSKLMAQPDEIGMRETQSACLIVSDADAVYATAKAAGGEMVMDIADASYGGRAFICRDLEGHLWSIGTYDPWEG